MLGRSSLPSPVSWQQDSSLGLDTAEVAMDQPDKGVTSTPKPIRKRSSLEREGWWRVALTNTPIPGTYHLKTFIEESLLNPVAATYNFKNEGRKKPPLVQRNNPVITDLPPYMPPDFLDLLKKQAATYSFKDQPRSSPSSLVYKDQELRISFYSSKISVILLHSCCLIVAIPETYNHQKSDLWIWCNIVRPRDIHRVTLNRFENEQVIKDGYIQHEGPGPGHYDLKIPSASSVTSCFRSKVPRFLPACSRTPGPGTYTSSAQYPKQPRSIARMGREHSLFFNNTIGF